MTIKVKIIDKEALQAIKVADVKAYLIRKGWIFQEMWKDRVEIYALPAEGQFVETLLATVNDFGDHPLRIAEILELLAIVEGRSELDVYADFVGKSVTNIV